jgi:hypothetical protein
VEKNSENSEENKDESSSEDGGENMKVWLQENLRMLVSIVIVVVIAGGIYAYSKRTQAPMVKDEVAATQDASEGKISVIGGDTTSDGSNTSEETPEVAPNADETAQKPAETVAPETKTEPAVTSQETGSSFVEAAAPGDSVTTLARRALANYLEKNPDASLTPEHKIYIEDYLRRQVANGRLSIGATREFSKDMIANAIEKSKSLNEKQLKNLQKYSRNVSGLN